MTRESHLCLCGWERTLALPCVSSLCQYVTCCAGLQGCKREQIVMVLALGAYDLGTNICFQIEVGDVKGKSEFTGKTGRPDCFIRKVREGLCAERPEGLVRDP